MTFISYAQNFEDVMLWRALKHIPSGFYIDVGANDSIEGSVTKAFYDKGWRGINIEPVRECFEELSNARPRDINLQVAAGAREGEVTLHVMSELGLSTIDKAIARRHKFERGNKSIKKKVFVRTITDICEEFHVTPIHFLKIDVEGAEKLVLEGIDFSKIRPWIVLVEATLPFTQIQNHQDWEPILLSNNYEFIYFDGLNRFYVAKEHAQIKESFSIPPNYFDYFIRINEVRAHLRAEQAERQVQLLTEKTGQSEALPDALMSDQSRGVTERGYSFALKRFFKWCARKIGFVFLLERVMLFVLHRPLLKKWALHLLRHHAFFRYRLQSFASRRGYISGVAWQIEIPPLSRFSPRAIEILQDLKTTMASHQEHRKVEDENIN